MLGSYKNTICLSIMHNSTPISVTLHVTKFTKSKNDANFETLELFKDFKLFLRVLFDNIKKIAFLHIIIISICHKLSFLRSNI